jgi:hypothetical protein
MADAPWYQQGYRRMLVDMHIADWDERFLSRHDPKTLADLYQRAGLSSAMFYCQSHLGLCYWPTWHGQMHAGLKGRDFLGEMAAELKARRIAAEGYFSVVFDNRAFLNHPDWRQHRFGTDDPTSMGRYGLVCPNHGEYRTYMQNQIDGRHLPPTTAGTRSSRSLDVTWSPKGNHSFLALLHFGGWNDPYRIHATAPAWGSAPDPGIGRMSANGRQNRRLRRPQPPVPYGPVAALGSLPSVALPSATAYEPYRQRRWP